MTWSIGPVAGIAIGALSGLLSSSLLPRRIFGQKQYILVIIGLCTTGIGLCSAIVALFADSGLLLASMHLAAMALPLSAVDSVTRKLPRRLVIATYPTTAILAILYSARNTSSIVTIVASGAAMWAGFWMLALVGGIGGGDVRLAPVLGIHLGIAGITTTALGIFAAFLIGGVAVMLLRALGRLSQDGRLPFGPALIGGSLLALAIASTVF